MYRELGDKAKRSLTECAHYYNAILWNTNMVQGRIVNKSQD